MTDPEEHPQRDPRMAAAAAIIALETAVENLIGPRVGWTTKDMGDFWHAATEACVERLVRLKPEMVRHMAPPPEEN